MFMKTTGLVVVAQIPCIFWKAAQIPCKETSELSNNLPSLGITAS